MRELPLRRIGPAPLAVFSVEWVRRAVAVWPAEWGADAELALRIAGGVEAMAFDPAAVMDAALVARVGDWRQVVDRTDTWHASTFAASELTSHLAETVRGVHADSQSREALLLRPFIVAHAYIARCQIASRTSRPHSAISALQHRTAVRAKPPSLAQLKRLPDLRTPTITALARSLWHSRAATDGAVLADALEEAGLATALAMPYRQEPESLTRADWLFWHLGCCGWRAG